MTGLTNKVKGLFDKADDSDGSNNAGDSSGKDVNNKSSNDGGNGDGNSERGSGRGGLRLKVIGTPQLLRTAQQLFGLAIGEENDDHSRYPEFLMDLDGILRKYGADANLAKQNAEAEAGGDGGDLEDQENWK